MLTKMAIGKKRRHLDLDFLQKLIRGCMKYEYVLKLEKKACLCLFLLPFVRLWLQNLLLRFAVPFERANHPDLLLLHEVALCP